MPYQARSNICEWNACVKDLISGTDIRQEQLFFRIEIALKFHSDTHVIDVKNPRISVRTSFSC